MKTVHVAIILLFLCCGCSHLKKPSAPADVHQPVVKSDSPAKPRGTLVDIDSRLKMRKGPSTQFPVCGSLRPGEQFLINEEKGNWCHVTRIAANDDTPQEGWIYKKYVRKTDDGPPAKDSQPPQSQKPPPEQDEPAASQEELPEQESAPAVAGLKKEQIIGGVACVALTPVLGLPVVMVASSLVDGSKALIKKASVANKRGKFKDAEAFCDACIEELGKYQETAQANNANLSRLLRDCKAKKKKGQIDAETAELLNRQKAFVDEFVKALEGEIEEQKKTVGKSSCAPAKIQRLQQAIAGAEKELSELRRQREELVSLSQP